MGISRTLYLELQKRHLHFFADSLDLITHSRRTGWVRVKWGLQATYDDSEAMEQTKEG